MEALRRDCAKRGTLLEILECILTDILIYTGTTQQLQCMVLV